MSTAEVLRNGLGALGLLLTAACVLLAWAVHLLSRLVELSARNRRDGLAAALDIYRQLEALGERTDAPRPAPVPRDVAGDPPADPLAVAPEGFVAWLDRKALELEGRDRAPARDETVPL